MIKVEYAYFDVAANEKESKETFSLISKYNPSVVSVDLFNIKIASSALGKETQIAAIIDYPCGLLDLDSRISAVNYAIKSGANIIEMVLPSHFLVNRKYDKFRSDITNILEICKEKSITLRYVLEYRVYSYSLLYKICQILSDYEIFDVVVSTGYGIDDIYDNIIAGTLIQKKVPKINPIYNGNIWLDKHIEILQKAEINNVRVSSINALDMLDKKYNL